MGHMGHVGQQGSKGLRLPNWRKDELSIEEVIEKHPKVPKIAILKNDLALRGYVLTKAAEAALDPKIHQMGIDWLFGKAEGYVPGGLLFRDGTSVVGGESALTNHNIRDPWVIDVVDGKLVATDQGKVYEEVEYWSKPNFYDYTTSKGNPASQIFAARPSRLTLSPYTHCHFWDKPGGGCRYCTVGALQAAAEKKGVNPRVDPDEIVETLAEALKQKGRFTNICISSGSIVSGKETADDEVDFYIELLQRLQPLFKTDFLRMQLVATAYNRRQLERMRDEGGLRVYTTDIEVLDQRIFEWICPGKAEIIGYEGWKRSLYDAVEVFGKGNVNAGVVGGVDLAKPHGHKTEAESLAANFAGAEELAKHGVSITNSVWMAGKNTPFKNQTPPSLDYYVSLAEGFNDIREAYGITNYFDDYRRCGNHPSNDLART